MEEHYYHMFANGDDAKNFITSEKEFKLAFNRFGVCQHLTGVIVLSASVEDSHPHALIKGSFEQCILFKNLYEELSIRSIVQSRGSKDGVILHCEIAEVSDEQYLMNVGTYTIVQATKDGKAVMPYDYLYGTGALYFRSPNTILPWMIDKDGKCVDPVRYGDLTIRKKHNLCATKTKLPDNWLICNGFVLPTNYIDVKLFENIYKTHNCFRAFMASGKTRDEQIITQMSRVRGVNIEDLQARELCRELCYELFRRVNTRMLNVNERLELARALRQRYFLSVRQLSFLVKIPETEIHKYIK